MTFMPGFDPLVLELDRVSAAFETRKGLQPALSEVSFSVARGEIIALVGESGAGKSLTGSCINGLLPKRCRLTGGEIRLNGRRIDTLGPRDMQQIRGAEIGTVFQDPLTSLNPLYTVREQLVRTIRSHAPVPRQEAETKALSLLNEVGIPAAQERLGSYPHEFSGGMRQRVVIALALALNPGLVIADEPTTALDVSIQAQILELLRRLSRDHGTSVVLVTHDMGVVAETADRVAVMYAGRIVEYGAVDQVLRQPSHPYTRGLLAAIPSLSHKARRLPQIPGSMPSLNALPPGCTFNPRCDLASERCRTAPPILTSHGPRAVACFHAGEAL